MHEHTTPREWLTVDQTFVACQRAGLDRTKKTIRSWSRNGHVEAQKQTTPTGERWMVEKNSLAVKIRSELEFQAQSEPVQTRSNAYEPVRTGAEGFEQVRTKEDPVRTRTNHREPEHDGENDSNLKGLRTKVRSLEIDKAVRDKQVEFLTAQNEEGQKNLLSQSRYIGHLETQVLQLGGAPDQTFLEAPVRREVQDRDPVDPNQEPLRPVQ